MCYLLFGAATIQKKKLLQVLKVQAEFSSIQQSYAVTN